MAINVGDKLPDIGLKTIGAEGPEEVSTSQMFTGKKVVMFAVPGAFTPTCHNNHLPGYIQHATAIKEKGVDQIAVLSVNDIFVMGAWQTQSQADGITFLADPDAAFTKAIGMDLDLGAHGLGTRSHRYVMIIDNGTVTALSVEGNPGQAVDSGAEALLELL